MSMVSLNSFTYLKDVKPFKTGWKVQIKVLHSWNQYTAMGGESVEFVLADSMGTKIHASCKKTLILRVQKHLPVGEWRFIENFSLTSVSGQYRPTNHPYKMVFSSSTVVTKCNLKNDDNFLSLTCFESITNGSLKTHFLVDVLGQILDVGNMETVQVAGKERKKIEFVLRNTSDQLMPCCLWGRFAEQVANGCEEIDTKTIICLIRFAKINYYRGELQITNAFDASLVIINPVGPDAEEFLALLPNGHVEQKSMKKEEWDDVEEISIAEMLMAVEEGQSKVTCTVYGNDTDWTWFYYACAKCNKKVTEIRKAKSTSSSKAEKPLFKCDTCDKYVINVSAKFKLHLLVKDDTSETKFMLLDTVAQSIVGQSADSLQDGSFEEVENPEILPEAIKAVFGKTFQFGVFVEKDNVFYGKETYKIGKVWSMDTLLKFEPISEKTPYSSMISSEQVSLIDVDSEDHGDGCSTPLSKRNQKATDLEDLNSVTKKQCTKIIKLEKMD